MAEPGVVTSQGVDKSYSVATSPSERTINILVPSGVMNRSCGIAVAPKLNVEAAPTVDIFQAVPKSYCFNVLGLLLEPTTYIRVPSDLKNTPVGAPSSNVTDKERTNVFEVISQAVVNEY